MRRLVRPFPLLALLCVSVSVPVVALQPVPGGGYNFLSWEKGSPAATAGGVGVGVTVKPTTGWTCTEVTLRVIDDATNKTLDTVTFTNPGPSASKSFAGLRSGARVRVTADATFQNGGAFDFKDLEEWVTPN